MNHDVDYEYEFGEKQFFDLFAIDPITKACDFFDRFTTKLDLFRAKVELVKLGFKTKVVANFEEE